MRTVLFFLSFALCTSFYSQATYFLTGRPFGFERNNAIKEVGLQWGFKVRYAGSDVAEERGLAAIASANDSVQEQMTKRKGADWLNVFYAEVDKEELLHQKIRSALGIQGGENRYVLVQGVGKRRYVAYVIDASAADKTKCIARYACKVKRKVKVKPLGEGGEIPYDFPENGIVKG